MGKRVCPAPQRLVAIAVLLLGVGIGVAFLQAPAKPRQRLSRDTAPAREIRLPSRSLPESTRSDKGVNPQEKSSSHRVPRVIEGSQEVDSDKLKTYLVDRASQDAGVLERLREQFAGEEDPKILEFFGSVLAGIDDEITRLFLVEQAFTDSSTARRFAAFRTLAWVSPGAALPRYLDGLRGEHDPVFVVEALRAMPWPYGTSESQAQAVLDIVGPKLTDPNPEVRAAAAEAFGQWAYKPVDTEALVTVAQSDPSPEVRVEAVTALDESRLLNASNIHVMAALASNPAEDPAIRAAAKGALRSYGILDEGMTAILK